MVQSLTKQPGQATNDPSTVTNTNRDKNAAQLCHLARAFGNHLASMALRSRRGVGRGNVLYVSPLLASAKALGLEWELVSFERRRLEQRLEVMGVRAACWSGIALLVIRHRRTSIRPVTSMIQLSYYIREQKLDIWRSDCWTCGM